MPPQLCDLWPDDIRTVFGEMHECVRNGHTAGLKRRCQRVHARLKQMETEKLSRSLRIQVARSFYDLSFFYKDLGHMKAAQQALDEARNRWLALLKTKPGDFYALTQLGACENLLGLMAADTGDTDTARRNYGAALDARNEANAVSCTADTNVDSTEQSDNWAYCYGVMCNLAHLLRTVGEVDDARYFYDTAIRGLEDLIPKHDETTDREVCDFFAQQWESMYGQPHFTRFAPRFLENAKWGMSQLNSPQQAET